MTVGQLIAILAEFDEDLPVMLAVSRERGWHVDIREVWRSGRELAATGHDSVIIEA
jgi:hypothetical protein